MVGIGSGAQREVEDWALNTEHFLLTLGFQLSVFRSRLLHFSFCI
jgi:hypothetical protein